MRFRRCDRYTHRGLHHGPAARQLITPQVTCRCGFCRTGKQDQDRGQKPSSPASRYRKTGRIHTTTTQADFRAGLHRIPRFFAVLVHREETVGLIPPTAHAKADNREGTGFESGFGVPSQPRSDPARDHRRQRRDQRGPGNGQPGELIAEKRRQPGCARIRLLRWYGAGGRPEPC